LLTGIARGYADLDWSALGLIAAEEAGLAADASIVDASPLRRLANAKLEAGARD
jgi:hypothetical protein